MQQTTIELLDKYPIIFLNNNHRHPLKGLLDQGLLMNLSYLKYSQKLETTYQTPKTCNIVLSEEFRAVNRMKIATKANNDPYPRPVVYMQVNPDGVFICKEIL